MATRNKADRQPSLVAKAEAHFHKVDDFVSMHGLRDGTGMTTSQACACLSHLKKHHAADCVQSDGELWWYLTPDTDTRVRHVEERIVEVPGTRTRRRKVAQLPNLTTVSFGNLEETA